MYEFLCNDGLGVICPPAKRTLFFTYKSGKTARFIKDFPHLTDTPKYLSLPEHFFKFDTRRKLSFGFCDENYIYPSGLTNIFGSGFSVCTGMDTSDYECDFPTLYYLMDCFWQSYFSLCRSYLASKPAAGWLNYYFARGYMTCQHTVWNPATPPGLDNSMLKSRSLYDLENELL